MNTIVRAPLIRFVDSVTHENVQEPIADAPFEVMSEAYNSFVAARIVKGIPVGKTFEETDPKSYCAIKLVTPCADGTEIWIYPQGLKLNH